LKFGAENDQTCVDENVPELVRRAPVVKNARAPPLGDHRALEDQAEHCRRPANTRDRPRERSHRLRRAQRRLTHRRSLMTRTSSRGTRCKQNKTHKITRSTKEAKSARNKRGSCLGTSKSAEWCSLSTIWYTSGTPATHNTRHTTQRTMSRDRSKTIQRTRKRTGAIVAHRLRRR
jgi:hypothetical protein